MSRPAKAPGASLVRAIGYRELTASIVNVTIASSIFIMPASVAAGLGAAAPVAYVVCAALMALIALCFAAAGSRVSATGGLYAYVEVAFGGYAGFLGGFLYWATACLSTASVAAAFAGSVGALWPAAASGVPRAAVLTVLFAALAWVNVRGIKPGIRLIEAITAAKLLPLVFLVAAGVWWIDPAFLDASMPSVGEVGQSAIVLIFAFVGVEVALAPSGEIKDPHTTVPRAILTALAVATTVYVAVQTVAQGVLGPALPAATATPLAETARRFAGEVGRLILLAGGTVSIFGYIAGDMLGTPRTLLALASNGVLPSALGHIHPRYRTPSVAIPIYALMVGTLAISSSFERLVVMANVSALLLYLLCVAASYRLQQRDVRTTGDPFKLPGGAIVQLAAAAGILWLLSQATAREWQVLAWVVAGATVYYLITMRLRRPVSAAAVSARRP